MFAYLQCTIGALLLAYRVTAQDVSVSLYPTVDPGRLAQAFNISEDCLEALNATLPCDPTLFQMANTVDNFYWELDNVTDLCTASCFNAVDDWDNDVQTRCALDSITAYGKAVPAASVSGRYFDGFHIACLTNQNATERADVDMSYCLIESQNWVGSDVIRPDCTTDTSDPSCADPTDVSPDNERLANLYGNDVLCSECFIQMMYQRLTSPYLPNHDYSDYLIGQYQDILDVCKYTNNMPELIIRVPPDYTTVVPPTLEFNVTTGTSCNGQTIVKRTLDPNANCNTIAQAFHVATGDVQAATGDDNCAISTDSICLPAPCSLHQIVTGDSCDSLAASFSSANLNVTTVSFLSWNGNINGLCDSLPAGDFVCASAPGGSYVPPPPPPGSANAAGQQRGGGDGNFAGTPDNTTTPVSTTATGSSPTAAPSPTQAGISSGCTKYIQAQSGDFCTKFAQANNITPDQLYSWNTVLGSGGTASTLFVTAQQTMQCFRKQTSYLLPTVERARQRRKRMQMVVGRGQVPQRTGSAQQQANHQEYSSKPYNRTPSPMSPYSLPQTLAAFHSFYNFLTTLPSDITPASILTPPSSAHGWPSLTSHFLAPLRKTPSVITLLQHLPYIDENPGTAGSTQIAYETTAIDFRGPAARWSFEKDKIPGTMEPVGAGVIPEWVVCLSGGGRDASWLLLDTREGTITDYIQQEAPERDEPGEDSPDFWRAYHTGPIVQFLEEWKEKYRSLEWVVLPDEYFDAVRIRWDKKTDEIRDIYRAHGWPDNFRRHDCREALLEWKRRQLDIASA
ncbi:MAG: hypothetical protein Q9212_004601 [Teloschistes hypoglaucus]